MIMQLAKNSEERLYTSAYDCITKIAQKEGIRGFYGAYALVLL